MAKIFRTVIRKHAATNRWELAGWAPCKASLRVDGETVDLEEVGELERLPIDGYTCEVRFTPDPKAKPLFTMRHGMTGAEYDEMVDGVSKRCGRICTACE